MDRKMLVVYKDWNRTKTKMGDRAFEVAGPRTWNSLPATIRETKTLPAFKKQLKLYLIGNLEY